MSKQYFSEAYGSRPPENYERFFVPAIGEPVANDLIGFADLGPGQRVLDVACGTGIGARLAAQEVGSGATVAGVDVNPGMLAVARSVTPPDMSIDWYESSAEDMPLDDETFDVVLCLISLQFMSDKLDVSREMRRVLAPGGRLALSVPGPAAEMFVLLAQAMEQHIGPQAAGFVNQIFSLHETTEIQQLLGEAGFQDIAFETHNKLLRLPPPKEFLWQFVSSTPLAGMVADADEDGLAALEREVVEKWQDFKDNGAMKYRQRIVLASARG
jgi:ubiquinone/menaquinone biosynthesis C-methylase UbiE